VCCRYGVDVAVGAALVVELPVPLVGTVVGAEVVGAVVGAVVGTAVAEAWRTRRVSGISSLRASSVVMAVAFSVWVPG